MKTIIIDGIEYNLTPKELFKKGDFVVIQETTYQITKVENLNVTLSLNGRECIFDIDVLKNAHLWDIAKDAKDGDVLLFEGNYNSIVLFHGIGINGKGRINYHCKCDLGNYSFGVQGNTAYLGTIEENAEHYHPATKEQRDLLFQKMKEAGYEWDAEKKELKKIEQNPAWSEEDEKMLGLSVENLTELKDRFGKEYGRTGDCIDWLKFLKAKCTWKPSKEQMKALEDAIEFLGCTKKVRNDLKSLYEQLKKLREG